MKRITTAVLAAALLTGCYHAVIETGAKPSSVVIEQKWAIGWIAGLIPPETVSTTGKCKNGVASVSTQHSIPNLLAQMITFSIFSPMEITVVCAQ